MEKLLKLDLQMFADGEDFSDDNVTGGADTGEDGNGVMQSFEEMYYNGAPDDTSTDTGDDGEDEGDGSEITDNNQQQNQPWKNQQNAQFAAQRRRQEESQRIAQATQAARDAVYAEQFSGTLNPYTGQPIKTESDYKAYMKAYNAELLKNAGIQEEQFNSIVDSDPRIQQAKQILAEQEQQKQQIQRVQQQQQLDKSVEKIRKFDKTVKTEQDIINNPHFEEIANMWRRGYSLDDAYYLANRAELEQKKQAATRQQTINQVTSKNHMKATGQNGAGDEVVVPPEQIAMYKKFMPDISEAEIKKHYARMTKKG